MIHVATSIEGLERLSDKELQEIAPHMMVNGEPLQTAKQVREALRKAREEGYEVIPAAECDHYDSTGRCLGHENF